MSSYIKALEGVLRLFPKKIKITLIDICDGKVIGVVKVLREELPAEFTKPVFLTLLGKKWRVLRADQMKLPGDSLYTQKLQLHVRDAEIVDPADTRFIYPTIAASFPKTCETSLFNDFTIDLQREQWRQIEFLPSINMPEIKHEIDIIRSIRKEAKDHVLLGYIHMRKRKRVDALVLNLPFDAFCDTLDVLRIGNVRFIGEPAKVLNSFALETANHTYYGIVEENQIRYLCLDQYDYPDQELMQILSSNKLVMLDWCERTILTGEFLEATSDDLQQSMAEDQLSPI